MIRLFFKYTSTIGLREMQVRRPVLDRAAETVRTGYGEISRKVSSGYGVRREKYEYEDLARIARERDITLKEVLEEAVKGTGIGDEEKENSRCEIRGNISG